MPVLNPFQLLEINIISAQELEPVSKKMKTYATAWVHAKRKLSTRIDTEGGVNPTWNEKFVFRVDEEFLRHDNAAVMIEIYGTHWFRDTLVGTVRVLVGNLVPPSRPFRNTYYTGGMRCVALQIRRPSGRPQGILNIGVTVLDSSMRSMPLYTQLSASAVGYRDLMGMNDDDSHHDPNYHHQTHQIHNNNNNNNNKNSTQPLPPVKPILRRSRSEKSTMFDSMSLANSSMVAVPQKLGKASSIVSGSEFDGSLKAKCKKGKASSVISGAELQEKPKPKGKVRKASSLISASIFSKDDSTLVKNKSKATGEKVAPLDPKSAPVVGKPNGYDYGPPKGGAFGNLKYPFRAPQKASSMLSGSEVGPSPSEVAMAMMERRYPLEDEGSSVLDGWSLDESEEGLKSKLERWRTELPPLYDHRSFSTSTFETSRHRRRHTDGGNPGLFSCFGSICGIECQCVCGRPPQGAARGGRFYSPSSMVSGGGSF